MIRDSKKDERTIRLIGNSNFNKLTKSNVLLIGVGGVGGYVCEALVRSGVGNITIIDGDTISESNINRQIIATYETIGMSKVVTAKQRILSISPQCNVTINGEMYIPNSEFANCIDFTDYDYVIDAIDDITAKVDIIKRCKDSKVPIISSMGTGNRLDNTNFKIKDIANTSACPLAKIVRKELKKIGVTDVEVLFSDTPPSQNKSASESSQGKQVIGSISYVPATAGLIIAGHVINQLLEY